MIGLGTMGRNFLLNVAGNGFACLGFDLDEEKRRLLDAEAGGLPARSAASLDDLIEGLAEPRSVMILVPAAAVDSVISDLSGKLSPGDLIIDAGNSHFPDTDRRAAFVARSGIEFLGIGVSGGEEGARRGPSIMAGGGPDTYERIRPVLEAVAAKVSGEPCAARVGTGSAGHFVKMVHNGIEYGMMQLIAEAYDLLRRGLGRSDDEIADIFAGWNRGELGSFLVEITSTVLRKRDPETGVNLVEMILDTAGQKGTGKWTSQAAMDLGVPVPTIDAAVSMRQISARKSERTGIAAGLGIVRGRQIESEMRGDTVEIVRKGLLLGFIATYAQGLSLLSAASAERGYGLDIAGIARIWRGGCIIRAKLLEDIRDAYSAEPGLPNLFAAASFAERVRACDEALKSTVIDMVSCDIPAAAFGASLAYVKSIASARLPANLIQAQRDYFGAHTYQRTDREGIFHTSDWDES